MPIQFDVDPTVAQLAASTSAFVRDVVIPAERACGGSVHDAPEDLRQTLQKGAREAGVFAPHVPVRWGGHGLDLRGQAAVFEAAGYSLLGPLALNCAAPDEGNTHLLEKVATEEQQERYLRPLATGEVRSCFAMTEPAPGAGADPRSLRTTATRVPGGWRIDGRKWFISGAQGAAFAIVMARTSGSPGDPGGATMFLVDAGTPGMTIARDIETLDEGLFAGHSEIVFDGCVVGEDQVLGAVGEGFAGAQVRLGPARMTHCMRWLGAARRAQDVALERAGSRTAFGSVLGDLGMVQQMLADSEIDIEASRALILRTAWELDTGSAAAAQLTSISKTFVAEAVNRVVDRAVQICGALGISAADAPLARLLREVRPFRIYDGPSETHRFAIARRAVRPYRQPPADVTG
ncbi:MULTISPECIES: acyl-CoA dehydrogenase family protein [Streptomyces]|uniref:Alkylation response protein AidB-like acyl-CoA dehydrogenase n=1 Tax=Streptomyces stelliscabiei TaxID=146820 RepID=A0A8I0PDV7_9ACTN|nr:MULTISPECIES: acyl-CoA dehydrogenase family protein [Streptomyces]KND41751.1 acyl-CoA dehydrogenase [Streptomyces stelliscabiei]MBE1602367.1 alkylation response protein AidB-like acyl-CoA dehydrogenase [Streptomyces stelliscabiei]MDX2521264.1 acyl-CoA dehydrogenase family protein [Streptomyces stelliscabiei]MDX2550338.1 acyl-CoA dehydrogenase family protein [Streptomyces stelliscabiei]MDX2610036.1 acyl-CoA dehydrogenase family protein [Streptomyces stelliscabiei]